MWPSALEPCATVTDMSRRFKTVDYAASLDQTVRLGDILPPDHLARFLVDAITQLDLQPLYRRSGPRGGEAYAPEVLLGLLLYGYATGAFSSRKLEQATYDDFIRYHTYTDLSRTLEAVSRPGCSSTVSQQPIPSPGEPGAFLVWFLNDQQDCVTRYLYRRTQRWQRQPGTATPRRKEGDAHQYTASTSHCWLYRLRKNNVCS
jgi:hypothetical protein